MDILSVGGRGGAAAAAGVLLAQVFLQSSKSRDLMMHLFGAALDGVSKPGDFGAEQAILVRTPRRWSTSWYSPVPVLSSHRRPQGRMARSAVQRAVYPHVDPAYGALEHHL